ncbi:hypothetical protein H9P43_004198 [Blastocladiella emersonii ATCC 22665]|nr:hypothetical protein H9P43_004198 [Blastocladiella emersonii ATCC 22665]
MNQVSPARSGSTDDALVKAPAAPATTATAAPSLDLKAELEAIRTALRALDAKVTHLGLVLNIPLSPDLAGVSFARSTTSAASSQAGDPVDDDGDAASTASARTRSKSRIRALVKQHTSWRHWRGVALRAGWRAVWLQIVDVAKFVYLWRIRRYLAAGVLWATIRSAAWRNTARGAAAMAAWRRILARVLHRIMRLVAHVVAPRH